MACLREQRLDGAGLYILASNGKTITLPQDFITAHFAQNGADLTASWLRSLIVEALGMEQILPEEIVLNLDPTGQLLTFGTQVIN